MSYDPNSNDSMLSRIMGRLDSQDAALREILVEVKRTNGRVTAIETREAITKGKIAMVSATVSVVVGFIGWLLNNPK